MNEIVMRAATSVGWVGAVGTVAAYALVSRRRLDADSVTFQMVNVVGAGLLAVSALSAGSWPSLVSNFVWMFIGVHTLVKARRTVARRCRDRWRATQARRTLRELPAVASGSATAETADEMTLAA